MPPQPPLLELQGITKSFGGVRALADVDLVLREGEVVALVGENGAGKSTLIKVITGIHTADDGTIRHQGREVTIRNRNDSQRLGIEVLYQDLALVGVLNAAENVFLGKELTNRYLGVFELLDNRRMQREAEEILLDQLGMDFRGRWEPVFRLSGGQRQAIALARAIYARASLVILDEPMASLGVEEVERTIAIIQRLRRSGIAVVVISHNLEHVFAVADRLVVIRRGRKVGDAPKDRISPEQAIALMVGRLDRLIVEPQPETAAVRGERVEEGGPRGDGAR